MDPQKPTPANLPVEPSDLSFQVMPQEGRFDPAVQPPVPAPVRSSIAPSPLPSRPASVPSVPPPPEYGSPNLMPEESEPSFFRSKWIYIVVGIVVLIVLGLLAYFLLGAKKTAAPVVTAVTTKLPKVWLNQYFNKEVCDNQTVCGDDADPDNDGLSNYNEFVAGTNPVTADSDSDGLADGDEVNIYKTEPTLKYTDRRDIVAQNDWTDGFQINSGYDPLTPGLKFTDVRNQQIASDTAKYSLHEPTITTLSTQSPAQTTAWKTYTNSSIGYTFEYPAQSLTLLPAQSIQYPSSASPNIDAVTFANSTVTYVVRVYLNVTQTSIEAWIENSSGLSEDPSLNNYTKILINGQTAYTLRSGLASYVYSSGKVYEISARQGTTLSTDVNDPIFIHLLSSFVLTK
ncbi:MAG: hypothetical protein WDN47_01005 [Candidatus Doudnabacteria bacterium]